MDKLTKEQIDNLPEWMPVRDFEGFYEVNCRAGLMRNVRTMRVKKPSININGYPIVGLFKDGKYYPKTVHRLVANAAFSFYNISTDGLDVCHLDETRTNSCIDNLALGSRKENANFPKAKQRCSAAKKGKCLSKEHRKKLSEVLKAEKVYWFNKHLSEETRKKLSEAHKGYHHSEETRIKISDALRGKPNIKLSKRVGAYKNGELVMTFQSTAEAGRNGFNCGSVSSCCTGKQRTHRGYFWKFL